MKGVVLAGGMGTRLFPLTKITNKHLLPIYDRPMIYYPIQTLVDAGIREIMIVTGGNSSGDFLRLLGNGKEFGLKHLHYTYQEKEGGIAQALGLTEHFVETKKVVVILGDNILEGSIKNAVQAFERQKKGAKILLKKVENPREYGVAELGGKRVVRIVEKPRRPKSKYAVTGIYFYDSQIFEIIHRLKPSKRRELEITDVNNFYIQQGTMTYEIIKEWWGDAGESVDALLEVNKYIARKRKRQ